MRLFLAVSLLFAYSLPAPAETFLIVPFFNLSIIATSTGLGKALRKTSAKYW